MDRARLKQNRICKYFIQNIGDILEYVRQRSATQGVAFKTFYTLASIHACTGEVSHALFSKLKQF